MRPKSCGPCTMCCKVLPVAALEKPAGAACVHLARGGGCSIYADRPHACRSFECVWLMDPEMPHRFRPDQTKVMLDQDADGHWLVARCDPANPHAALKGRAMETWGSGKIVLAVAGRRTWLITPREDMDLGEFDLADGLQVTENPDGGVEITIPAKRA